MSKSRVGIFAKHWTPGEVKTRLAASTSKTAAAEFHRACVEAITTRLEDLGDERVLMFAPSEKRAEFKHLPLADWTLEPQATGDLGTRIHQFFQSSFAAGYDRVVLLGTDSPNVPLAYVEHALESLRETRLVLGPTNDGGYYLVGAHGSTPPIFDAMPWSTNELWPATLRQLDAAGWQQAVDYTILPPWYDVDTRNDLERLHRELLVESIGDEVLTALLATVALVLGEASEQ